MDKKTPKHKNKLSDVAIVLLILGIILMASFLLKKFDALNFNDPLHKKGELSIDVDVAVDRAIERMSNFPEFLDICDNISNTSEELRQVKYKSNLEGKEKEKAIEKLSVKISEMVSVYNQKALEEHSLEDFNKVNLKYQLDVNDKLLPTSCYSSS